MSEEPETKKWNNVTGAAFAIAIVIGAVVGYLTEWMNAVFAFLIVSGIYFAVSFYIRDDSRKSGEPSMTDGAIMGGVLLTGIGICGFIYYYTKDAMITAIAIIAVMLIASATMIIRNRRYL